MKVNKEQKLILAIGFVNALIWMLWGGVVESPDSHTYIEAWDSLKQMNIDANRTPTYPFLLGILKTLLGAGLYKYGIIIVQYVIFVLSSLCFYMLASYLCGTRRIPFWGTLAYVLCPGLFAWGNEIVTESLSISGVVFFIYAVMLLYEHLQLVRCFYFCFWFLFLIFLRPSFIYLLPVLIVFWIAVSLKNALNSQVLAGVGISVFVGLLFLGYMGFFKNNYGVFSPSYVGDVNRYYIARQYGLLKPQDGISPAIRKSLNDVIDMNGEKVEDGSLLWKEIDVVFSNNSMADINATLTSSQKRYPLQYFKATIQRAFDAGFSNVFRGSSHFLNQIFNYLVGLQIRHVYLFLILFGSLLVFVMVKNKTICCFTVLMYMIGSSNLIVALVGAQSDWGRLNICVFPIYLLMFFQIIDVMRIKFINSIALK